MKLGILGSGQLARMMALAGYPLGLQFSCYSPDESPTAADVMFHQRGAWNDEEALRAFAADKDFITFETENIPLATVQFLVKQGKEIAPSLEALRISQDRLYEKDFIRALNISTAVYYEVNSLKDLKESFSDSETPHFLKARRNGYDGKNQYKIIVPSDLSVAWNHVGSQASILEERVDFECEVSLIAVRGRNGGFAFYPLTQNLHREGILLKSRLMVDEKSRILQEKAEKIAKLILNKLNYVGVLTIEFFVLADELIVNEIAPRVHNSGHWTIDAAVTSQFENHLRAVTDLSLGNANASQEFLMFNILGYMPAINSLTAIDSLRIHDYRKLSADKRKLGHLTLLSPTASSIRKVEDLLYPHDKMTVKTTVSLPRDSR